MRESLKALAASVVKKNRRASELECSSDEHRQFRQAAPDGIRLLRV
jgi:hypothetical protein